MSLEVTGLRETQQRFAALAAGVRRDGSRIAVRAAAEVLKEGIESAAPVLDKRTAESTAQQPGALKAGIEIRMKTDRQDFITAEVGPKGVLSHVAYWVEFGHNLVKGGYLSVKRGRLQGHGRVVGRVTAHPFIRPATDEKAGAAVEKYASAMAEWMKGLR